MNIVPTNIPYTYFLMHQNLILLKSLFPFIQVEIVGKSVLGKNIYAIKLGIGARKVFYSASIHANESITSILLMKFIENYCDAFYNNSTLDDVNISKLFNSTSIFIIPMVNPDGVDLVNYGYLENSYPYVKAKNIANNFPDIPFPKGWKSNINGVDFSTFQPINYFTYLLKTLYLIKIAIPTIVITTINPIIVYIPALGITIFASLSLL